jgi:hypothetical protein
MIKNILDTDFKYEDDKMYRKFKTKWVCCNDNKPEKLGYIRIRINNKLYSLHRLVYKYFNPDWDITDTSNNNLIDHFDIDPTNNKIENLRLATRSQNNRNIKKKENFSSKYRGVFWNKSNSKWRAEITINGKKKHLGYFINEKDAYECYKKVNDELMNF